MAQALALQGLIRRSPRRVPAPRNRRHSRAFGRARTRWGAPMVVQPRAKGEMTLFVNTLIGGFWFVSLLIA